MVYLHWLKIAVMEKCVYLSRFWLVPSSETLKILRDRWFMDCLLEVVLSKIPHGPGLQRSRIFAFLALLEQLLIPPRWYLTLLEVGGESRLACYDYLADEQLSHAASRCGLTTE